ncbi:MAG TPA: hypothetical protein PK875_09835, partial [Spirochaetota bacterium]|nr:hypothetical protein [Spirochaetota bacterium]
RYFWVMIYNSYSHETPPLLFPRLMGGGEVGKFSFPLIEIIKNLKSHMNTHPKSGGTGCAAGLS